MLSFLYNLFIGNMCKHEMENIEEIKLLKGDYYVGHLYIQQCTKCGCIKKKRITVD